MNTSHHHGQHRHESHSVSHGCCSPQSTAEAGPLFFSTAPENAEQSVFYIDEMDCPTEESLLRKVLEPRKEVRKLEFDLLHRKLNVIHDMGFRGELQKLISNVGMVGQLQTQDHEPSKKDTAAAYWKPWLRTGAAVALALVAELLSWLSVSLWLTAPLSIVAIALCGFSVYKKGWIAIRYRDLNINALMSIAVTGAMLLGEWPEAAMVMSLFTLAELIEARSLDRARAAVDSLLNLTPDLVSVKEGAEDWKSVSARDVQLGALIKVLPGQRLGLDGQVESGSSVVNQAPITGESAGVTKAAGDQVYAGSINGLGELQYRVTTDYDHSLLARITHAVQQAQQNKAPTQRFVDAFSRVYTPIVVVLAAGIAVIPPLVGWGAFTEWVYRALVLLVIACPCALVISTPVAVVSALTASARQGLLVKGGVYLERARRIQHVILDKTGTLTQGMPRVQDVFVSTAHNDYVQTLAYSLALRSDHPASQALVLAQPEGSALEVSGFSAIPGQGVEGVIEGRLYRLGSRAWASAEAEPVPLLTAWEAKWQAQGASFVYLYEAQTVMAAFAINDVVKEGAAQALKRLASRGVTVSMASGDNRHAVSSVAAMVGLSHFHAELLPEQKLDLITQHQKKGLVAMVGDGINDAPALAQADISFAMGAMGSDIAIDTADITILNDDLNKLADVLVLSTRLHRVLVQNISAALAIKAVFLLWAILGGATMWMAVFADVGASLLVVLNSLRLLR